MAATATDFYKVGGGGANGIHFFNSTDAIGTIDDADYFLTVYDRLAVNDVIIAVGSTGGTRTVDVLVVVTASSTGVTTILGT
jgi:hypothetical protein